MIYLISDTHLNHKNILEFCNRPFTSIEEMNETIIKNIQAVVKAEDTLIHLGDVAFGPKTEWPNLVPRMTLNANTDILVLGNHDIIEKGSKGLPNYERTYAMHHSLGWDQVVEEYYFEYAGLKFWCAHIPLCTKEEGRGYRRPIAQAPYNLALCGHVHERFKTLIYLTQMYLCSTIGVWNAHLEAYSM